MLLRWRLHVSVTGCAAVPRFIRKLYCYLPSSNHRNLLVQFLNSTHSTFTFLELWNERNTETGEISIIANRRDILSQGYEITNKNRTHLHKSTTTAIAILVTNDIDLEYFAVAGENTLYRLFINISW